MHLPTKPMSTTAAKSVTLIVNRTRQDVLLEDLFRKMQAYRRAHFDLGTGDAQFIYELARKDNDTFYVGIDSNAASMTYISWKVARKPAKGGGVLNLALVHSSVEKVAIFFSNQADSISINYPWASLLKGIVAPEETTVQAIAELAKKSAIIDMRINNHVFRDENTRSKLGLPSLDTSHVMQKMVPVYEKYSIRLLKNEIIGTPKAEEKSSWGKQLRKGSDREVLHLQWKRYYHTHASRKRPNYHR